MGVGSYLPPNKVTNHDLEKIIDTNDEWIRQRSGIEARYWAPKEMGTVDLAEKASIEAIEKSGLDKSDIDFIICASISNDAIFQEPMFFKQDWPSEYQPSIFGSNAGFVYATFKANQFIESGMYKNILVVGVELQSRGINKTTRRRYCVLLETGQGQWFISR